MRGEGLGVVLFDGLGEGQFALPDGALVGVEFRGGLREKSGYRQAHAGREQRKMTRHPLKIVLNIMFNRADLREDKVYLTSATGVANEAQHFRGIVQ